MIREQSGFVTKFNTHSAFGSDDWTNPKLHEPYRDFRVAFVEAVKAAKPRLGDLEKIKWNEVILWVGFSNHDSKLPKERTPQAKEVGQPDRWGDELRMWVSRKQSFDSFDGFLEQLCKPQKVRSNP